MLTKANQKLLSPAAEADGAKSGLTKRDMQQSGMYSLTPKQLKEKFGINGEGYAIPYDKDFYRVKILTNRSKFGEVLTQKYTQEKGTTSKLYFPKIGKIDWAKVGNDTSIDLLIIEGEKKAAAACKAGYAAIGISGVWCFKNKDSTLLEDWKRLNLQGRNIYIAFDSDIVDKPQVRYAEYSLATSLINQGATVKRVRLARPNDQEKVGVDDFLVANGLLKDIRAARAAFDALPRERIDPALPPHLTELGNAIRFAQEFSEQLKFVPNFKKWMVLNSITGLWEPDEDGQALRAVKTLPYKLRSEANSNQSETAKEKMVKWAHTSESQRCLLATLKLAESELGLIVNHNRFDKDPWKVAFLNKKYIDLKTGKVCNTEPSDFFTKAINAEYLPNEKCPLWEKFLIQIANGDKELVKFLQRVIGWCLTGDMSEQCFFILWGMGANGKSTFLNTLLELFGGYGRQASPQTFMIQKNESSIRSDLVRLLGVRFIATSETENNQRLAESLIKQWTGGEQISTRDLYGKNFEFQPQGKILLATNHKPKIYGPGEGIWRRVILVPFTRTFTEKEKDLQLGDKLKDELPGILNWALEGCVQWQKHGLRPPASIALAINHYRADMDSVGSWIEEKCEVSKHEKELLGVLYDNYSEWAKASQEYVMSKREFSQRMEERGFVKKQTTDKRNNQKGWFLLGIHSPSLPTKFQAKKTP